MSRIERADGESVMEFRNPPSSVENERIVKLTVIDDRGNIPLRLSMRSATVHASSHPDDASHHASGDALGPPPFQACLHGCFGGLERVLLASARGYEPVSLSDRPV